MNKKTFFYTLDVANIEDHRAINQHGFIVLSFDNDKHLEPSVDDVYGQIKMALNLLFGVGEDLNDR